MKQIVIALALVVAFSAAGSAHKFEKNGLAIHHPWTRATAPGAAVGVGYLSITNEGKEADTLTGGTFEGAGAVEIHEMKMDGDKMMMRQLKDGVEIKPGETVKFAPGSYHLMFTGLKAPIAQGPQIKGSLTFSKAGSVDIAYKVEAIGATSSADGGHDSMKMDGSMKMDDMSHDHPQ